MSESITRTAFDALPAVEKAKAIKARTPIVDESAAEAQQRAELERDRLLAEGKGQIIRRGLFDTLDAQGKVDFLKGGGRVVD